jgi:imidazolonepropionase-like amidohydrolase
MRTKVLLAAAVLSAVSLWAQAPPRVAVKAARMLDVKSGQMIADPVVVVEGDKIVSVGTGAAPAGVKVVNLGNATLLPGLIDAHTHLTYDPQNFGLRELEISIPKQALIGAKNARTTLLAGFTTVRNVGADGYTDIALRDEIDNGDLSGPRMDASGPLIGITGGHCDNNLLPYEYHATNDGIADGVEAVQHKVREIIKYGADVIKVCATGGVMSKGDDPQASQYSLEELKAIVADAHRLGRKVAAHAHGAQGILWATEAGVDSIEHGTYINDEDIAAMKQHGTYLVPTQYLMDWWEENGVRLHAPDYVLRKMHDVSQVAHKNIEHAIRSGVKIAFGTDAAVYPHGLNAHEFAVYVKMGMTPLEAIRTATVNAADLLGWSDRVGTVEPGKFADLIAVDGDPAKDVTTLQNVRFVMKGGKVYKNEY